MANRKKRRVPKQFQEPIKEEKAEHAFQDEFQSTVGDKIEDFTQKFEGKGRTITYALAAIAVLFILGGIFFVWSSRSNRAAQTALGKAIVTSQAVVSDSPVPAGSDQKVYKTEKERAEASITEFQAIVDKYGGQTGEKARYFVAVNRMKIDRPAGIEELTALSQTGGEVGTMSKFALAQALTGDKKLDEAVALYQELAAMEDPIIAKETISFALADIFEEQGKTNEAADIYFNIAKTASEAKDADGKAIPMSSTARDAKTKLEKLNPEKAKEIQEPEPESPMGGLPMGM